MDHGSVEGLEFSPYCIGFRRRYKGQNGPISHRVVTKVALTVIASAHQRAYLRVPGSGNAFRPLRLTKASPGPDARLDNGLNLRKRDDVHSVVR